MLVLTWKLRPAIRHALAAGLEESERQQEVAMTMREARDTEAVKRDFGIAALVIMDLGHVQPQDAISVSSWQLELHPFVQVDLIAGTAATQADHRVYFELGKAGVQHMHLPEEASTAAFWIQRLSELSNFDLITRVLKDMSRLMPPGPPGEFLARIVDLHGCASVKSLADKMYPGSQYTAAYKRRMLWQECKSHGYASPEAALSAVRLRVLKSVLDSDVWTYDRVARHFGFETARHLNRSCNNRYGLSVTAIRKSTSTAMSELAEKVFWQGHPARSVPE